MNRNLWAVLVATSLAAGASAARADESPEAMKAFSGARFLENVGNGSAARGANAVYAGDERSGTAKARLIKANYGSRGGKAGDAVVPAPAEETPGFWSRVDKDWRRRMRAGDYYRTDIEEAAQVGGAAGALIGGVVGGIGGAAACSPTVVGAVACGAGGAVGGGAAGLAAGAAAGAALASGVKYVGAVVATAMGRD